MSFKRASDIAYFDDGGSTSENVNRIIFELWKNQIRNSKVAYALCDSLGSDSEEVRDCYLHVHDYYFSIEYDMWTPQAERERAWEQVGP